MGKLFCGGGGNKKKKKKETNKLDSTKIHDDR